MMRVVWCVLWDVYYVLRDAGGALCVVCDMGYVVWCMAWGGVNWVCICGWMCVRVDMWVMCAVCVCDVWCVGCVCSVRCVMCGVYHDMCMCVRMCGVYVWYVMGCVVCDVWALRVCGVHCDV